MLDNYAIDQYRNWFNDHFQRVTFGLTCEPDPGFRKTAARVVRLASILVASVFVLPFAAVQLTTAATADPFGDSARSQIFRWEALLILAISSAWVFLHLRFLPGRRYDGPVCGNGLRPTYKRNGFAFFLLTFAIVATLTWLWGPWAFVLLPGLCLVSVVLCILVSLAVYSKACLAPDPSQCSAPSNLISDVFHGLELYPRVGELHLKQALIRLGAVLNLLVLWSCFFTQLSPNYVGFVIIGIRFLHAARRFWNEECYSHSLEVSHYKLGLRELFRHLVMKPFLLNLGTISSVHRPPRCGLRLLILLGMISTTSIVLTYMVDRQKFLVKCKKGKCLTWDRTAKTINAFYEDAHGLRRSSTLLYSGFWGLARHLNYTLEFVTHCALAVPSLLDLDWFSAIPPLLVLVSLLNRGREDFMKCRRKYGPYWEMYCVKVPHAYIPGLW